MAHADATMAANTLPLRKGGWPCPEHAFDSPFRRRVREIYKSSLKQTRGGHDRAGQVKVMTFQDLGSIGEFVAAIATLGTLFYLALQIRQNSRSVRSAAFQSAVDGINQINNAVAQDESLARILRLGNEDQSNLTEDERVRYGFAYLSTFRCLETMYFHYREGTGTKLWEAASKHITALLSHSGSREWWSGNPYEFTNEFKQLVDEQIAAIQVSHARHE